MRRSRVLLPAGWLPITPLIIGCTSSLPLESPPTPSQAAAKAVGNDYIIGPGDTLEVFVWRNPELSVTIPVRPDGKISTPLVENMVAIGKPPLHLGHDIVGGLGQFASGNRARIVRVEHGQQTTIHVKLADLVNSGDVRENMPLKPGDVLVVPQPIF